MKINVKSDPRTYNTDIAAFNKEPFTTSGSKGAKIIPKSPPEGLKCVPLEGQSR